MKRIFLISLAIAILFIACDSSKEVGAIGQEESILIAHKTYGILSPDGKIIIGFNDEIVKGENIGERISEKVFDFKPDVKGETYWQDTRTLVFEPEKPLPMRTEISGKANLGEILSEKQRKGVSSIALEFYVSGLELSAADLNFKLADKNNPREVLMYGELHFNMAISLEDAKKDIKFIEVASDYNRKIRDVDVDIKLDETRRIVIVESKKLNRPDNARYFNLVIEGKNLDLDDEIVENLIIPSFEDFKALKVIPNQGKDANSVSIRFSDLLDNNRDYKGFINIEPHVEHHIAITGSKMTLRGDFEFGKAYNLTVRNGTRSLWGIPTKSDASFELEFADIEPAIEYMQRGMYLPSSNQNKIQFRSANVRKVYLTVKQVYSNNLVFFMQDNYIGAGKKSNNEFWNYTRVGKIIHQDTLEIGSTRNVWLQSEIDLSPLLEKHDEGLFILELQTDRENLLYEFPESWHRWKFYSYMRENAFIVKPIIISDIGLICKKGSKKYHVFANNIKNAKPLSNIKIDLISYQNQVLASGVTNSDGHYEVDKPEDDAFIILAEKNGQSSALEFNERVLSTSLFDVAGIARSQEGLKAYIYTDRGVYRPGDSIFVSAVVRNTENSLPDDHPVIAKLYDARGRFFKEILSKDSNDGLCVFKFKTSQNSPTGNWRLSLKIGESEFSHIIKVETIVPYKLKVNTVPSKELLDKNDRFISARVESKYLFGTPASGHDVIMKFVLQPYNLTFDKFSKFSFSNEGMMFQPIESQVMNATLDGEGVYDFNWKIPYVDRAPSGLKVSLQADVLEKGGRKVPGYSTVDYQLYDVFVGFQKPEGWYVRTGREMETSLIAVNPEGMPIAGRNLKYRVYQNSFSWWYDYDNADEAKRHFKTDNLTELVAEGVIQSSSVPVSFSIIPEDYGKLYVEIQDGSNGHTAGYFINAYDWGSSGAMPKDADMLSVVTDKEKYHPGDSAYLFVKTPPEGKLLLSLEKGAEVIETKWFDLSEDRTVIPLKITDEMMPNVYAHITVIQPHSQTQNDRPMRMFGIAPIMVEDLSTRLDIKLKTPEKILPESEFVIELTTKDGKPAQFTIAIVDEGILDITRFKTPDPWEYFFRKEALGVVTADIYSMIIGANWGNPFKSFSIGGDFAGKFLLEEETDKDSRRFKPVAMFKGPIESDSKGRAKVKFTMPNYMGSVRVMAVAVRGNSYGNAEKAVPVKAPLMVLPYLPRVLAPEDIIKVPISVFATEKGINSVNVNIEASGPVEIMGEKSRELKFTNIGDEDIYFDMKVLPQIGPVKLKVTAKGGGHKAYQEIDLISHASSPPVFRTISKVVQKGESAVIDIPQAGIAGTNRAKINISRVKKLAMNRRLSWLLHYPYGCIEQTTSAVFPQLYIRDIVEMDKEEKKDIDKRINEGIERIQRFQTREGGLSYWPNQSDVTTWGTNYAMHFLIEAKSKGYHVPDELLGKLVKYQKKMSRAASGNYLERTYRIYVLALSDNPDMGAMNLLRENSLTQMNSTARWYLAAAYKLAGQDKIANQIMDMAGTTVAEYNQTGGNFGSTYRDKAIILEMMAIGGRTKEAMGLYEEIATRLDSDGWMSTQTTGYCLLAMGKFTQKLQNSGSFKGKIHLPNGDVIGFTSKKTIWSFDINDGFGESIIIDLESSDPVYASLDWEGIPARGNLPTEAHNLNLQLGWYNDAGNAIDPSIMKQGDSFWGVLRVTNTTQAQLENLALVQMLPSGWEIENVRLHGQFAPEWISELTVGYEEYMDIRDDRIIWFFDFGQWNNEYDFVFKINAVTPGQFYLPPSHVEAMYDRKYYANQAGKAVTVKSRN